MSPGCGSFGSSTVRARNWGPGARLGALRPHVGNRSRGEGSGPVSHVYGRRTDQRLRATVRGLGARGSDWASRAGSGGTGRTFLPGSAIMGSGYSNSGNRCLPEPRYAEARGSGLDVGCRGV